jgi:hypothetical protein
MSNVIIEVDAVERWDIVERRWKIDWSERRPEPVDIDVAVKVQIGIVADVIEEVKARHEIARIIVEQGQIDDPAVW